MLIYVFFICKPYEMVQQLKSPCVSTLLKKTFHTTFLYSYLQCNLKTQVGSILADMFPTSQEGPFER